MAKARGRLAPLERERQAAREAHAPLLQAHQEAVAGLARQTAEEVIEAYRESVRAMTAAWCRAVAGCEALLSYGGPRLIQGNAYEWMLPDFSGSSPSGWLVGGSAWEHQLVVNAEREKIKADLAEAAKA